MQGNLEKRLKIFAHGVNEIMAKPTSQHQDQIIMPGDFFLPFGGKLNEDNRWVRLAKMIP